MTLIVFEMCVLFVINLPSSQGEIACLSLVSGLLLNLEGGALLKHLWHEQIWCSGVFQLSERWGMCEKGA